ncbi:excitatory amino acid transporter 3 [Parasteatoda tepidariorum]|uniref:excitatory amino acid transporter 3 n=1 Tax=Parasteatoda tepidariorum TaxID=114398 RepID=UPI00077F836B|nr:excitatory amino acid transporter 3-like [Parasteatoda tepidariorum]
MAIESGERKKPAKSRKEDKEENNCECLPWCRNHGFLLLLLLATVSGYVLGILLKSQNLSNQTIRLIGFPGQLVIRAFFMIIVPLLFCSLVLGVSSLRKGGDARMVAVTIAFFLGLSSLAAIMGAGAGHIVHPGQKITSSSIQVQTSMSGRKGVILDSMMDLLWNAIPSNIIEATFTKEYTHVEILNSTDDQEGRGSNSNVIYKKSIQRRNGVNFMGLLCFSILFGCALASLGDKGEALHQVIEQLNAIVMKIMLYFLKLLPIGMFFWMFREGLVSVAPVQLLEYMGVFLATAMGIILFHQFILLPGLYLIIVRKNPIPYHLNLLPAILTAFGTASSAATLPATVRCAEEVNMVNKCVTRFVLPLGMVVHMNGGTFYITLSTIFLAQLEGIELGATETIIAAMTSVLLFIAAPATAGGGNPVYLLTVMAAVGINKPQYVSLFLSMEWLMERFRTVMNVVADSYVAAFVEKLCQKRLPLDLENVEYPSPVIDGYNQPSPPVSIVVEPPSPHEHANICRCCGSRVDVA